MSDATPLHAFAAFGIESEYMIVDRETLDVLPICDRLLTELGNSEADDVNLGVVSLSNELALHVVELKTTTPTADLVLLQQEFHNCVTQLNDVLSSWNACLMPTAMHPWMDPAREFQIWPHEYTEVYHAFDKIFDCRGHGWANLQSVHINFPFCGDDEFGRLHAAIRVVLPLLPALAASSPILEGSITGKLDNRLHVYRQNAARVVEVTGQVIPEPVFSPAAYDKEVLQTMYQAIAPLDPNGVLQHEWLNARGAIPRFDRGSIEIRLIDIQECVAADMAVCDLVIRVVKHLYNEQLSSNALQRSLSTSSLYQLLLATIDKGDQADVTDTQFLEVFGIPPTSPMNAGQLWREISSRVGEFSDARATSFHEARQTLLNDGPLARRMQDYLSVDGSRVAIQRLYHHLCRCLSEGRPFRSSTSTPGIQDIARRSI